MKKNLWKRGASLLAVLVLVIGITACGGKDMSDSPYLGKWVATTVEYSEMELSVDSIFGEFSVTLTDDGKCILNISGEEESGKWSETEKGFNVEDEFDFTVDGDKATLEYEGMSLNFEREK